MRINLKVVIFDVSLILFFALFDDGIDDSYYFADGGVEMIFETIVVDALIELFGEPGPSMAIFLAGLDQSYIIMDAPNFGLLGGWC